MAESVGEPGRPSRMTRHGSSFLIALSLLATAGVAAAKPAPIRPDPDRGRPYRPPAQLEVTRGDPTVAAHVEARAGAIARCLTGRGTTFVRARVRLTWARTSKVRSIGVSGGGAAFARCVGKALRGSLPGKVARGGSGRVEFVVRAFDTIEPVPVPMPEPEPKPLPAGDIHACRVDSDCTLHFRLSACVPGDPVAVNTLDPAKVRTTYPVRRLECAMGGPQYDELLRSTENRWAARCEQARCVVHDAGPQPTHPFRLAP